MSKTRIWGIAVVACTVGCASHSNPASPPTASSPGGGSTASAPSPDATSTSEGNVATPADSSWSLREREVWACLARQVKGYIESANRICGAHMNVAFDAESFRGRFDPSKTCGFDLDGVDHVVSPIAALQQICADGPEQRASVSQKIDRVEVRYTGAGRSSWSLDRGVFTGLINPVGETGFDYRAAMRGLDGVRRAL